MEYPDKRFAEEMRKKYESIYREDDPTAVAVVVEGNVDYDNCSVIDEYKSKGYHLVDANAFGFGMSLYGEVLIFGK